jgi:hypothetical protein
VDETAGQEPLRGDWGIPVLEGKTGGF